MTNLIKGKKFWEHIYNTSNEKLKITVDREETLFIKIKLLITIHQQCGSQKKVNNFAKKLFELFLKEQKLKELANSNYQKVPNAGFIRKFYKAFKNPFHKANTILISKMTKIMGRK